MVFIYCTVILLRHSLYAFLGSSHLLADGFYHLICSQVDSVVYSSHVCVCVCARVCVHVYSFVSESSQTPCTVAFRPLCPWNSPGKNTGVGSHFLLQDLPNPGIETFSHISCIGRRILYHWHHLVSPYSSPSFNKYRQLFVNHHIFSCNSSFMPQIPLSCFLVIANFSIPHPLAITDLFPVPTVFHFPEFYASVIIHYVALEDQFLSLTKTPLRFMHNIGQINSLFLELTLFEYTR